MTPEFRASEAKRLLDEPLLKEALEDIEQRCMDELLRLPTWRGHRQRVALIDRINTIRELRSRLHTTIMIGRQSARNRSAIA